MTQAVFTRKLNAYSGVQVSGHSGYAEKGADIVCAAVSSAVQLAANGITEVLGAKACVATDGDAVEIILEEANPAASSFLEALYFHLTLLSEEYSNFVNITVLEV